MSVAQPLHESKSDLTRQVEASALADRRPTPMTEAIPQWVLDEIKERRPGFNLALLGNPAIARSVAIGLARERRQRQEGRDRLEAELFRLVDELGFEDVPGADWVGDEPRIVIGDLIFKPGVDPETDRVDLYVAFLPEQKSWAWAKDAERLAELIIARPEVSSG